LFQVFRQMFNVYRLHIKEADIFRLLNSTLRSGLLSFWSYLMRVISLLEVTIKAWVVCDYYLINLKFIKEYYLNIIILPLDYYINHCKSRNLRGNQMHSLVLFFMRFWVTCSQPVYHREKHRPSSRSLSVTALVICHPHSLQLFPSSVPPLTTYVTLIINHLFSEWIFCTNYKILPNNLFMISIFFLPFFY
jgi:hypothetical protein